MFGCQRKTESEELAQKRIACSRVKEYPFVTPVVFRELGGHAIPSGHGLSRLVEFLEMYEKETLFKLYDQPTLAIRVALGWQPPESWRMLEGAAPIPENTSPRTWDRVASLYTAYRLIDVYKTIETPSNALSERHQVIPKRFTLETGRNLLIPDFWNRLEHWPKALKDARTFVERKMSISKDTGGCVENPHIQNLEGLARSLVHTNYTGLANNFQVAALHLGFMMGMPGIENDGTVLPDIPEDKQKLLNVQNYGSIDERYREAKDNEVVDFLQNTTPSHLRVPLQVALAISPLCLLWKLGLHKSRCDRCALIEAARALGNTRPRELMELEKAILLSVFRIAMAPQTIVSELKNLVSSSIWMECESLREDSEAALFFCVTDQDEVPPPPKSFSSSNPTDSDEKMATENEKSEATVKVLLQLEKTLQQEHQNGSKSDTTADRQFQDIENEGEDEIEVAQTVDVEEIRGVNVEDDGHEADEKGDEEMDVDEPAGEDEEMVDGLQKVIAKDDSDDKDHDEDEEAKDGDEEEDKEMVGGLQKVIPKGDSDDEDHDEEEDEEMDVLKKVIAKDHDEDDDEEEEEEEEEVTKRVGKKGVDEEKEGREIEVDTVVGEKDDSQDDEEGNEEEDGMQDEEVDTLEEQDDMQRKLRSRNRKDEVVQPVSAQRKRKRKRKGVSLPKSSEQVIDSGDEDERPQTQPRGQEVEKSDSDEEDITEVGVKEYIDVDLWAERLITLDVKRRPPRLGVKSYVAYGPTEEPSEIHPIAHDQETIKTLVGLWEAVTAAYEDGKPLHLSNPDESGICVITYEEMQKMRTKEWLKLFEIQNVVLTGKNTENISFREALVELGNLSTVMTVQDLSIPAGKDLNKRCREGSIAQVLEAAETPDGKILNCLDIGRPGCGLKNTKIASNATALNVMRGDWKATKSPPMDAVNWALAGTAGAFHTFHMDSNGFVTFVEIKTGEKTWYILRPRKCGAANEGLTWSQFFLSTTFDVAKVDWEKWIVEAIVLKPGDTLIMRPNTLHCVYTPIAAVVHGGHCYSTSTLPDTLLGIVHAFMAGDLITNTHHLSARFHLQAMIDFFHLALVGEGLDPDDKRLEHVPNIEDESGYRQLVAICIFGILINILDFGTYRYPGLSHDQTPSQEQEEDMIKRDVNMLTFEERRGCMHTQGKALQILNFVKGCFEMKEQQASWKDIKSYHEGVIVQQCTMLMLYKMHTRDGELLSDAPGCSLNLLSHQIMGLSRDPDMAMKLQEPLSVASRLRFTSKGTMERGDPKMTFPMIGCKIVRNTTKRVVPLKSAIEMGCNQRDEIYLNTKRVKKEEGSVMESQGNKLMVKRQKK